MHLFKKKRDIIIVTGRNAVGKTTASNYLRKLATLHNIPYESRIIADSQCLFEEMEKDDRAHGLHHTHDWCRPEEQSHIHDLDQPVFPFTVTDNALPNRMRKRFFKKLTKLPSTDKFWFVEWAGGVNTNANKSIDYSYSQVKFMLERGKLPYKWLKRVQAVIHVTAEDEVRFALNKQRSVPFSACPEAIEKGTAFWQKNERVLEFYGKDDFFEIEGLLENAGISICMIENNGNSYFFENLEKVANKIFLSDRTANAKSPIFSSASVDVAQAQLPISGIWAAIRGISMLPFGASTKNTKADKLPASVGVAYLEEQE
jgi:hypothetical protein